MYPRNYMFFNVSFAPSPIEVTNGEWMSMIHPIYWWLWDLWWQRLQDWEGANMIDDKERFVKPYLTILSHFTSISKAGYDCLINHTLSLLLHSFIKWNIYCSKEYEWTEIGSWLEMRSWNYILMCLVDNVASHSFSLFSSYSEGKWGIG